MEGPVVVRGGRQRGRGKTYDSQHSHEEAMSHLDHPLSVPLEAYQRDRVQYETTSEQSRHGELRRN